MDDAPLNVLLFAGRFEVRGTFAYTLRLAEHLAEHGVLARLVCSDARKVEWHKRSTLALIEYPHFDTPLIGRIVLQMLKRELAADPPDLIHIQSRKVVSQGAWIAARLNCPFVMTLHDYLQPGEKLAFDRTWGRKIMAVSESVRSEILRHTGLPPEMTTVIHPGVDPPGQCTALQVLDPGHVPVVGTAGPLEAVKGVHFFLGAAQKVLAQRSDVEFLVAGAGPEEHNLRRLARDLGISGSVTFIPNLFDFSRSLTAMDIFCLPSLKQGLGTTMLEAMALGRPVIATGVGGVYSVVHDNRTGLVVPPGDSTSLANRILELLNDPVRARAIGEAARQKVRKRFRVETMVQKTVAVYRDVLAQARAHATGEIVAQP
jgi:glycosyltransferase involved in cell wall biosynthesis